MTTATIWVHYPSFDKCNKINVNHNHGFTNYQWKKLVRKWTSKGARRIRADVFQTNPDYRGWIENKPNSVLKQQLEFVK